MRKQINILLFLLALALFGNVKAQDAHFSQFYAAPLFTCPSFAGATDGSRVVMNYRDQWPQLPGDFVTYSFSVDHYIRSLKSGIGLLFFRDQAGTGELSTTTVGWQYSYNIRLNNKWYARPGLHFLYSQRSVNFDKQTFVDQISLYGITPHTIENFAIDRVGYLDFSSSALFYSRKHWAGVTFDHMLKTDQSFLGNESSVPLKTSVFLGKKIDINKRMGRFNEESMTVSLLFQKQAKFKQLTFGAYWYKAPLVLGIWYRGLPLITDSQTGFKYNDAAIFLVGFKTIQLTIGYSYDFTISHLIGSTGGAHEVSIVYEFNQSPKVKMKRKHNIVSCPKF
ncbi:MAG: hypothetical protein A2W98_05725 [Bacteroidetes bacterium GWF2_33_38]|nr:MAG: hypothetical protein A2W98_05725 [Bacteroidetes bacterium GWF2_33_38]OFY90694.1 MAG: hypothetical protein A2236_01560 [Bacteroidetes bacterium RIFOXYA2_FULL_33_7]